MRPNRQSTRLALILAILAAIASGLVIYVRNPARPRNRLNEVWATVDAYYYDRTFNGYDWPEVRKTFASDLPWFNGDGTKTDEAISRMLGLLESSHLAHLDQPPRPGSDRVARVGVFLPELRAVAGMTVSSIGVSRSSRVLEVDTSSAAFRAGVRKGMSVWLDPAVDGSQVVLLATTHAGREIRVMVPQGKADEPHERMNGCVADLAMVDSEALASVERRRRAGTCLTRLRIEGLGLQLSIPRPSVGLRVTDVELGSAAEVAGVEPGSVLVGLQTDTAKGGEFERITVELPSSRQVHFQAPVTAIARQAVIPVQRDWIQDGVAVIRFDAFDDTTFDYVRRAVGRAGPRPIVVDLRNNTGGSLATVLDVLSTFVPKDTLIGHRVSAGQKEPLSVSGRMPPVPNPVAVLIGPITASGGEVMASALRRYRGAHLIGLPTSGEVVVANGYPQRDGTFLQVPVASFTEPDGGVLEGVGVTPDVRRWKTLQDIRQDRDPVVLTATHELLSSGAGSNSI